MLEGKAKKKKLKKVSVFTGFLEADNDLKNTN